MLGTISSFYDARYPGIAMQALTLTALTAGIMLIAFRTGLIKPTEKFRSFVVIATISIFAIYMIDFILGFFGKGVPLSTSSGTFGILFSLFVVGIAALNLILDFGRIEEGVRQGAPKYMEWYGAFALMVTLIWLYLEMLRLLAKLQSRR
ncbi:MAG TPA: Bax inhibitor-1/YccA family protein [Candidatus Omnitrophota bacterium]|nr:Bax inhibitor-1/YccA family protein [Candidatus Omnitrophota bacterium]